MIEIPSLRPETRYGMPMADLVLINRQFIVGYSYLFRQPRWALELITDESLAIAQQDNDNLTRLDNFREDLRVPEMFRATLADYKKSGFDRGHFVPSQNRLSSEAINSETFLLSNMSPQHANLNRKVWLNLEKAIRELASRPEIVEVYTICGPLFQVGDPIDVIGKNKVVVPDLYFKSVLAETAKPRSSREQIRIWTFVIKNQKTTKPLEKLLVPTEQVERQAGLMLWDRLRGETSNRLRKAVLEMW